MSNPYLLLWLEAPLQSWGFDSKFGRRETLKFPTRSGVVGLVCSALGAGGEQRELLAEFSSLRQTVIFVPPPTDFPPLIVFGIIRLIQGSLSS